MKALTSLRTELSAARSRECSAFTAPLLYYKFRIVSIPRLSREERCRVERWLARLFREKDQSGCSGERRVNVPRSSKWYG